MSLAPGWAPNLSSRAPEFQLTFARLVTHYWSQGCFLEEGEILAHMHRLADIPAVLIHGRYDVSGPLDTAWHLHRAWPNSKLVVLDDARARRRQLHQRARRCPRLLPHPALRPSASRFRLWYELMDRWPA